MLSNVFEMLIELIAQIWRVDTEIRDNSIFGESEWERRSRRFVAWVCGGLIVFIALIWFLWWLARG
jgi:hypothetical protein